jgi:hypothetical protein
MEGIQTADRLYRKRSACACEHGIRDADDITAAPECLQPTQSRTLIGGRQTLRNTRSYECARGFCERQRRRNTSSLAAKSTPRSSVLFK